MDERQPVVAPGGDLRGRAPTHGAELGVGYRFGALVVDRRTNTPGFVADRDGGELLLRPVGGGREWTCPPGGAVLAPSPEA